MTCGHLIKYECSKKSQLLFVYKNACNKKLSSGHNCKNQCIGVCSSVTSCFEECVRKLKFGHECKRICKNECKKLCSEPCERMLPCGSICKKMCNVVCQDSINCQNKCIKTIFCGYKCTNKCSETCSDSSKCTSSCNKTKICGHKCQLACNEDCDFISSLETSKEYADRVSKLSRNNTNENQLSRITYQIEKECPELVSENLTCGCVIKRKCHESYNLKTHLKDCKAKCKGLKNCGHNCMLNFWICRKEKNGYKCSNKLDNSNCALPRFKILNCGHGCKKNCREICEDVMNHLVMKKLSSNPNADT